MRPRCGLTEQPKTRFRKKVRIAIVIVIAFVLVWGFLTTDSGTVRVDFGWERSRGFTHIRTASGLGRILDPPYDHIFTNPIITMQVAPRLSRRLSKSGVERYEGHIDYRVFLWFIVGAELVE